MAVKRSRPNGCDKDRSDKEGQPTHPSGNIVEIGQARFERFMRYKEEIEKAQGVIVDPAWIFQEHPVDVEVSRKVARAFRAWNRRSARKNATRRLAKFFRGLGKLVGL
jgi:hypothetical protein